MNPTNTPWVCARRLIAFTLACYLSHELPAQNWKEELQRLRSEMSAMRRAYEDRITVLERKLENQGEPGGPGDLELGDALKELEESLSNDRSSANQDLGQTTRFNNAFNPSFALILDFSGSASTLDTGFDDFNRFRLRVGELAVAADIDPYTHAYGVLEFEEEGAELAELAVVTSLDRFFENSEVRIRAGRFFADLDPLNPRHEHDYPFVHQPAAKIAFHGGNLVGQGVEIHDWEQVGDVPVRFSVGMLSHVEGHSHAEGAPEHGHGDEVDGLGRRDFKNFSYTARVAATLELSEDEVLTFGGSVAYSPQIREFEEDPMTMAVATIDTRQVVEEFDWTYVRQDGAQSSLRFQNAFFFAQGRFLDENTGQFFHNNAWGTYAFCEYTFNPQWSAGAMFDFTLDPMTAGKRLRQYSIFGTWRLSPQNRLRLQVQHTDLDPFADARFSGDHTTLFLQWTVDIGSHSHGIDWAGPAGT